MWPFKYPYTNFHELNLDWIISEIQNIKMKIATSGTENAVKIYDTYSDANSAAIPINTIFAINKFDNDRNYGGLYYTTVKETPLRCGNFYALPVDLSADGFGAYTENNGDNKPLFQGLVDSGFPIVLKDGLYYLSNPIDATNKNVYLKGYNRLNYESETASNGYTSTVLAPNGVVIGNNVNDDATLVHGTFTAIGVEFTGSINRYSKPVSSFFANCLKQANINFCTFRQFAGFVKGSMHIATISNCLFCENQKGLSGHIYDSNIDSCYFVGNQERGVSLEYSSASVISNSKSEFNGDGTDFYLDNCTNVKIENCVSDHNTYPVNMIDCKMCSVHGFTVLESKSGISLYNVENILIDAFCTRKNVDASPRPTYHFITVDGNSKNVNVKLFVIDETNSNDFTPVLFSPTTATCNAEIFGGYQLGNIISASGSITTTSGSNRITLPLPAGGSQNTGVVQNTKQVLSFDLYDTNGKLAIRYGIGNNGEGDIYNPAYTEFYGHIDNKNTLTISFNTTDVGTVTYRIY